MKEKLTDDQCVANGWHKEAYFDALGTSYCEVSLNWTNDDHDTMQEIDWPEDWPEKVSVEFVRGQGFEVFW